jgi:hypothetical protein
MNENLESSVRKQIRRALLYLLLDDAFLLCNVAGALPVDGNPDRTRTGMLEMAQNEALLMSSEGLITPLECFDPETQRRFSRIDPDRQTAVLMNLDNWAAPSATSTVTYWLELMPLGEKAIRAILAEEKK